MPVHLLRDADIKAISLVKQGANRKRFFLFKSEPDENTVELGGGRLVKAEGWETVYCVVAEPDAHESPGSAPGTDQSIEDRWADEDEIRKAAHRFMANKGLVTKMHESMEPYGVVVENAIAHVDFPVGSEVIKKGSWYVAIQPTEEGRVAINKGEFTGVSIEGAAVRELVEKKVEGSADPSRTVDPVEKSLLQKIAEKVLGADEVEKAELTPAQQKLYDKLKGEGKSDKQALALARQVKKAETFGDIMAQREFDEALPDAFSALRQAVTCAFFPPPGEEVDATKQISDSMDQFKSWALDMLEQVPLAKAERAEALGVELTLEGSANDPSTKDGDMTLTDSERAEFDGLKKQVEELPAKVTAEMAKALGGKVEETEPTAESIAKAVKDLAGVTDQDERDQRLAKIEADVKKLAEGDSSQSEDGTEPVEKQGAEQIRKAFEAQGVSTALAGGVELMDRSTALAEIKKAAIETGVGGQLNDQQSDAFIQEVQSRSTFGSQIRSERRRAPKGTIDKMGISSRLIRGHKENTDDGYRAGVNTGDVPYDAGELWLPFEITRNFVQENLEGAGAEAKILSLMFNQWGLDLDDLRINGDEDDADDFVGLDDGVVKLVTSSGDTHHVESKKVKDAEGNKLEGAMASEIFFALVYATPTKYINSGRLRWHMSPSRWVTWIESLINRPTSVGDAALTAKDLYPLGIPPFIGTGSTAGGPVMPGIPSFPDDLIILADPQNFCEVTTWDIEQYSVKAGQDWELTTRRKDGYVSFIKRDLIVMEDDAISYADELSAIGS